MLQVIDFARSNGYEPEGRLFESARAHHKTQRRNVCGDPSLARAWPLDLLFAAHGNSAVLDDVSLALVPATFGV
jgi:hypothetical protein